jgi:hypothetical protein
LKSWDSIFVFEGLVGTFKLKVEGLDGIKVESLTVVEMQLGISVFYGRIKVDNETNDFLLVYFYQLQIGKANFVIRGLRKDSLKLYVILYRFELMFGDWKKVVKWIFQFQFDYC